MFYTFAQFFIFLNLFLENCSALINYSKQYVFNICWIRNSLDNESRRVLQSNIFLFTILSTFCDIVKSYRSGNIWYILCLQPCVRFHLWPRLTSASLWQYSYRISNLMVDRRFTTDCAYNWIHPCSYLFPADVFYIVLHEVFGSLLKLWGCLRLYKCGNFGLHFI